MRTTIIHIATMLLLPMPAWAVEADSLEVKELKEIVVSTEKPQVKSQDGALIVDLPEIVRDKPVNNILEALAYLPGVTTDGGVLGLAGTRGLTIIINGEPTTMPLQNLYQLLSSLPVSRMKNVEIMYAAPAKYHASGAVINVVLKTPRAVDGLMGQATTSYTQHAFPNGGAGLAASYAVKDWSFDLAWDIARVHSQAKQSTLSKHDVGGVEHVIEEKLIQRNRSWNNSLFASAAYRKFKISYTGQFVGAVAKESEAYGTIGDYFNSYDNLKNPMLNHVDTRYEWACGLDVGASFTSFVEERRQHLMRMNELKVDATNAQNIKRWQIYADESFPVGAWQLNLGAKYQCTQDHSIQKYNKPVMDGFNNKLTENVASAYVGAQGELLKGLSISLSLKEEFYNNADVRNWNFVPQLSASFMPSRNNIFQLNFTSERVYPAYWQFHGGSSYLNDYTIILGNPDLRPCLNYSGTFSYIFRQKYVATLYTLYSDDYFVQLPYQKPDELKLLFQNMNLDFNSKVGIQIIAPFRVGQVWDARTTLNVFRQQEKASRFHDISFDNSCWGFRSQIQNTFRLNASSPFSLSVDAVYQSKSLQGISQIGALWWVDAGAKWRFGKDRCCDVTFKALDIFNTLNPVMTILESGQDYRMNHLDYKQEFSLSFTWRFNGFKPKDTTIDTSRFGT